MSRGKIKKNKKIRTNPDIIYNSLLLSKFINYIMRNGNKFLAENIIYKSFVIIKKKTNKNSLQIFEKAINHVKPIVEIKSRKIGGANYQVPIEIKSKRSITLAMKWIIESAKKRHEKTFILKLANEIMDASNESYSIGNSIGKGESIRKRENIHRMAESNRAFAHYKF